MDESKRKKIEARAWIEFFETEPEKAKEVMENASQLGLRRVKLRQSDGSLVECYISQSPEDKRAWRRKFLGKPTMEEYAESLKSEGRDLSDEQIYEMYFNQFYVVEPREM